MIDKSLLRAVLTAEMVVLVAAVAAIFLHAFALARQKRVHLPRLARARAELALVLDDDGAVQLSSNLDALDGKLARRLLLEIAPSLGGIQRARLGQVAEKMGVAETSRKWITSRWWWRRLEGVHLLSLLVNDDPVLLALMDDTHPTVRAQAIEWAGGHIARHARSEASSPAVVTKLVERLGDSSNLCRYAARDSVTRAGGVTAAAIAARLSQPGPNLVTFLEVAASQPDPRFEVSARTLTTNVDPAIRACAARLLGMLGTEAGVGALELMLADEFAEVRAAAAFALGRIGHWPSAMAVADLLADAQWEVRKAAGEALVAMGPPGFLVLRRRASEAQSDASDLASLMLAMVDLSAVPTAGAHR